MEYPETPKAKRRIELLVPDCFDEELEGNDQIELSRAEVDFFKDQGFIVKRGLIPDRECLARIVDYVWKCVPRSIIQRDNAEGWSSYEEDQWTKEDSLKVGLLHTGMWKMRSPRAVGTEKFILDSTANHPQVRQVVAQFLDGPIKVCDRVRGVYVILPKPNGTAVKLGPHADHAAAQLCAMVLVDDVLPRSGGFTVWPTSHRRLHNYWKTIVSAHWKDDAKEAFVAEQTEILNTIRPMEFVGNAGDVVFWHPRLLHSAGVNESAELGDPRVRYVVPCDFQVDGHTLYDDDVVGPGEKHQWWVDTRHFVEDVVATEENIWHGWAV